MAKITIIAVVTVVFLGIAYNFISNERERRQFAEIERQQTDLALAEVQAMINAHDAVDNWLDVLAPDEGFRSAPILTYELEKIWISDRPILFSGEITDIATVDEKNYLVTVACERRCLRRSRILDSLRLHLRVERQLVDEFLLEHPAAFSKRYLRPNFAIVATIESISSMNAVDADGFDYSVKIGHGFLVELYFLDRIRL